MAKTLRGLLIAALLAWGVLPGTAQAVTITFQTIDLADTIPGEDLWRYTYLVSGLVNGTDALRENLAVETLFDPTLYRALQDPPPGVNADWDVLTLPPDPLLPDVGRYSALALRDGPSLAEPFSLTFAWLGGPGTAPGSQPFEINEFDATGTFLQTLETGLTTPAQPAPRPVPLPSTLVLMATGLLLALGVVRAKP